MLLLTRLLWTQLCPVVDSVLGVVNELLGAVLGKLGSTLLLLCTCCYLSWSSGLRPVQQGEATRSHPGLHLSGLQATR